MAQRKGVIAVILGALIGGMFGTLGGGMKDISKARKEIQSIQKNVYVLDHAMWDGKKFKEQYDQEIRNLDRSVAYKALTEGIEKPTEVPITPEFFIELKAIHALTTNYVKTMEREFDGIKPVNGNQQITLERMMRGDEQTPGIRYWKSQLSKIKFRGRTVDFSAWVLTPSRHEQRQEIRNQLRKLMINLSQLGEARLQFWYRDPDFSRNERRIMEAEYADKISQLTRERTILQQRFSALNTNLSAQEFQAFAAPDLNRVKERRERVANIHHTLEKSLKRGEEKRKQLLEHERQVRKQPLRDARQTGLWLAGAGALGAYGVYTLRKNRQSKRKLRRK